MPRINIEDSLFRDERYLDLVAKMGCKYKALGIVTSSFILAQKTWLKSESIPQKAWPKDMNILIELELAEVQEDGSIYIKGSRKQFDWLRQKQKAGKKSAQKRAQRKSTHVESRCDISNENQRLNNGAQPLSLSLSLIQQQQGKLSITQDDIINAWEKLGNRTKGFFLTPSQMRKLVELNNYFTKEKFDLAIERLKSDEFYLKANDKNVDMILSEEILGRVFQKESIADLREAMIED
jgi:hypothetical protein